MIEKLRILDGLNGIGREQTLARSRKGDEARGRRGDEASGEGARERVAEEGEGLYFLPPAAAAEGGGSVARAPDPFVSNDTSPGLGDKD